MRIVSKNIIINQYKELEFIKNKLVSENKFMEATNYVNKQKELQKQYPFLKTITVFQKIYGSYDPSEKNIVI